MGGTALKTGGADVPTMMAALFGTLMLASCTEMVLPDPAPGAPYHYPAGFRRGGDDYRPVADSGRTDLHRRRLRGDGRPHLGAPKNLLLAGIVLALIIILNRQRNPYLRIASLVIAMAAGYLAAWFLDMLPANTAPTNSSLITVRRRSIMASASTGVCCCPDAGVYDHLRKPSAISPPPPTSPNSRSRVRCI